MSRAETRSKLLPLLKGLVVAGSTMEAARAELERRGNPISRGTATNWRREDEKQTGNSWDEERSKAASQAAAGSYTPEKLLAGAAAVLGWLLDAREAQLAADPKGYADALSKAQGLWVAMLDIFNDADRVSIGLVTLAHWARETLSESEWQTLGEQLERFQGDFAAKRWRMTK